MSQWYTAQLDATGDLVVTFHHHPEKRWFPPAVLQDLDLPVRPGHKVILTGLGAVWMYFHVACSAVARGAGRIEVRMADGSKIPVFPLDPAPRATWCEFSEDADLGEQMVEFSGKQKRPDELTAIPLRDDWPLRITGSAAVWMYAAAGSQSARLPGAVYDSPREPELISVGMKQPGITLPRRESSEDPGVIIGIVGDPNSGKSVFVKGLFEILRPQFRRCWAFDCDAASPTPNWYLSLLDGRVVSPEDLRNRREEYKVQWTPELEASVAARLESLKQNLSLTLADLPGGKHPGKGDDWPPDRIPESRTAMFRNIDRFIVLGREDRPEIIPAWRQILEERGCGERIIAELASAEPGSEPGCLDLQREGLVLRGHVCGLDRQQTRERIAAALSDFGAELLDSVRWWRLAGQARAAVVRAFLTKEGGVRYGAAALTADGRTFFSGQYSSFNHVTNVHAEQAVLAAAAAAGSADVVALAVASTERGVVARPCGVCRQVMLEHASRTHRDFSVVMVDHQGRLEHHEIARVSTLLPSAWQSHRQTAGSSGPSRHVRPRLQDFTDRQLMTGAHVQLPGGALALVWDGQLGGAALVKVKYRPLSDGVWEKLPHSFSDGRRYLAWLQELGLAAKTFCGATAALARAEEIKQYAPPIPATEASLPACLASCLTEAGILGSRWFYTGSRALGLSDPSSDHDLIVQATPEEIRRFRDRCATAVEQRGEIALPPDSGTWRLLDRVFPGGRDAIVRQRRFLETVGAEQQSFVVIFVPPDEEPLAADGWTSLGWQSVCGRVEDDRGAAYKRARFRIRAVDGRPIDVVSYHKLANLVRTGDTLALGGWLLRSKNPAAPYRLYQVTAAIDNLIWMDAASC